MATTGTDLNRAVHYLQQDELVAIPTETVYGLAGNAYSEKAVVKIFSTKKRPSFDPLIVHTNALESAKDFLLDIPDTAHVLAEKFWPGPLTLILPKNSRIPDLVSSGLNTVGVRIPRHPLSLQLLEKLDFPLAAPSANPFGYISPTTAQHVEEQLGAHIPYILDGGACEVGVESTILGFDGDTVIVYRLGGMSLEELQQWIPGKLEVKAHSTSNPVAPGQLESHYAPRKPLILGNIQELLQEHGKKGIGVLSFKDIYPETTQYTLSASADLAEAARNLFKALRVLDSAPVNLIIAERVPDYGLGRAINDRLRRASAGSVQKETFNFDTPSEALDQ
ncbi:L-threonylcarbamoyladenylate synthase [Cesiribacter sp. SM1]|uniref:L-threonylcarbamoyladenylate synthase n=1 Tax=Cesiribacter sp. SM1 TaxID=2861196 RepID=UPI001CD68954|nr:L-threonylcarbamoyladenylate synthase [Cesiribacter sp. SM1]